jgi:hypothetical protein
MICSENYEFLAKYELLRQALSHIFFKTEIVSVERIKAIAGTIEFTSGSGKSAK